MTDWRCLFEVTSLHNDIQFLTGDYLSFNRYLGMKKHTFKEYIVTTD